MHSIIVNPVSGGGTARAKADAIKKLLADHGIESRIDFTQSPDDARLLAEKAVAEGLAGVVAVGGDGTFSSVVNGIGESRLEVLFAPCGTGNDFMRMFRMPKDTIEALKVQLASPSRKIDIGKCNDRYFLNVAGCGFDVDVLIEVEKCKGRFASYLRGAYRTIKKYRPMKVRMSFDDGTETDKLATIISIGNGSFIGGGMHALPGAEVDDGSFDVMIAGPVNKLSIYVLLILFALGKHLMFKKIVSKSKCKKIHIAGEDLYFEADGEVFQCSDATLEIVPGALLTRLPVHK